MIFLIDLSYSQELVPIHTLIIIYFLHCLSLQFAIKYTNLKFKVSLNLSISLNNLLLFFLFKYRGFLSITGEIFSSEVGKPNMHRLLHGCIRPANLFLPLFSTFFIHLIDYIINYYFNYYFIPQFKFIIHYHKLFYFHQLNYLFITIVLIILFFQYSFAILNLLNFLIVTNFKKFNRLMVLFLIKFEKNFSFNFTDQITLKFFKNL